MAFAEDVKAAMALLGGPDGDRVVDFVADPGAACAALDEVPEQGGLVLRALPPLELAAAGYAPSPLEPTWVRIMRGATEVGTAALHGGDGMVRRAVRVDMEECTDPCCNAPGCDLRRVHITTWLVLEDAGSAPRRFLVMETRALQSESDAARVVGERLAEALGVPFQQDNEPLRAEVGPPPAPLGEALDAAELGRFSLRTEGDWVVLRDWDSTGPRATARRNAGIGAVLMAFALALWFGLYRAVSGDSASSTAIALGAGAALLTLAGYAFLGVARFSAKYHAGSAPLVAVGRGRLVVLPWVGRDGAVDLRPEGRHGAGIPLHEVRSTSLKQRPEGTALELDTDHGPMDVLLCASERVAALWGRALDRAVDEARHPRAGASARQRARARGQVSTA